MVILQFSISIGVVTMTLERDAYWFFEAHTQNAYKAQTFSNKFVNHFFLLVS